ncbi:NAD(P)H-binding protein [Amycolatopsis suaedae]|uniref:NAD-dependent epimerase/dehydratase family protein n=1 Tax=Amycolatopsis suaedae TaxID=2510978 RepID=A0A4Q7J138_9PSEU|nr:NAD(P)H-binding protein [Amycolatopsis suaedae]RZQ60537.1 NAD-dependent epimerase/dehydratase family protein [Amycolatopsis suaedae]
MNVYDVSGIVLVTGATGTVGRQVVRGLADRGQRVRALTRNPATATGVPDGVEVAAGDLADPATLGPALAGVTKLHLISFAGDGYAPLVTAPEVLDLAVAAGTRRVTVLTGYEEGPVERAVERSGVEWTHLQPVEFMANALGWADTIRAGGTVREFGVHQPSAKIHEADIAAVAVEALLDGRHAGRSYPLTGPAAITVAESVATIGAAIGRDIPVEERPLDELAGRLRADGHPEETVAGLLRLATDPPAEVYTVLPTVEEVTGTPARPFTRWVAEHAGAFR